MEFLSKIPVMDRDALRELKKGIDYSFKNFSREYGDAIEGFFDPLLAFLIFLEKLLVNTPWPIIIGIFGLLAWIGFEWKQSNANGARALLWWRQWKKSRKVNRMYSKNLNSIFEYNSDDCLATLMIAKWLIDKE